MIVQQDCQPGKKKVVGAIKVFIDEFVARALEQHGLVSDGVMVCMSVF